MSGDEIDRRRGQDRRGGHDRRTGTDRRAAEPRPEDAPLRYVDGERRSGGDRRQGRDRRSGLDRRAPETPREQISRALDLVAYVAESTELTDAERRALDTAIMRLRFTLARLEPD
jgi:hypothetical protein